MIKRLRNQRGAALLETAITLPLILLVSVAIFEFGRAYQAQQVLTNAAREGARVAVLPGYTDAQVTDDRAYLHDRAAGSPRSTRPSRAMSPFRRDTARASPINYPFNFMVLEPGGATRDAVFDLGSGALTMQASALMRNE